MSRLHRRIPAIFGILILAAACLGIGSVPSLAAASKNLGLIDITANQDAGELSKARAAFSKGDAIVRIVGGSPADFHRLLGAQLGDFQAFVEKGQSQVAASHKKSKLKLQAVAAYRDANGVLRSVLSFAPDGQAWQKRMDEWIAREQVQASGFPLGDDPTQGGGWTLLYSATFEANDAAGALQSTEAMYRLNTTDPGKDAYLVLTVPETIPYYSQENGYCDGIARCDWHLIERDLSIDGNGLELTKHEPTGTITSSTTGFTIGANVGPTGPGASAGFSASWSTPSIVTTDYSDSFNGSWKEAVTFSGVPCVPVVNTIPGVSTGTFESEQAAIFKVPGGTSDISLPMTQKAEFCAYYAPPWDPPPGLSTGVNYEWITVQGNFPPLGPPVLQAFPKTLTIPAGGTQPLVVDSYIPNSAQGLVWRITSNDSWLTVPSSDKYSTGQVLPVRVAVGTPDGSIGTLSIDTDPAFAAPSVVSGPITVNVTVGTPRAGPVAGVLISGGRNTNEIANPYFYNLVTGDVVPLTPIVPRTETTATLLKTGNVLIAGGATNFTNFLPPNTPTSTAELFNPGTASFSSTGSLDVARMNHSATLLDDGKVLIAGGTGPNGEQYNTAELYDPATGKFTSAGTLNKARTGHHASLISQPGKPSQVLIYGGYSLSGPEQTWELWDETANTSIRSGPMAATAVDIPQPLPLADGTLDLVGGWIQKDAQAVGEEQILTPDGPSFAIGDKINVARSVAGLTALPNGELLLTGGATGFDQSEKLVFTATAEVRNAAGWNLLSNDATCSGQRGCLLVPRGNHTATLLPNGEAFIAGGENTLGAVGQSEFYNPVSGNFLPGPMTIPQFGHNATVVATTETSLLATPSSAPFGSPIILSAAVTAPSGVPNGIVRFLDGQTEIDSAPLVEGKASISTAKLSIGSHTLTAAYVGEGMFIASISPNVSVGVGGEATQTTLGASPNPASFQTPVILTANVTSGSGTVTGSVVFQDGSNTLGTANLNKGSAVFRVTNFTTGPHALSASFAGNSQWGPSAGTTDLIVRAGTTGSLQSSVNPSELGASVTFTARVSASGTPGTPTGSVAFSDGNILLGTSPLKTDGTSQFTTSALTLGTHSIVAAYSGDTDFSGSTSSVSQTVNSAAKAASTTALTSTPNPSAPGASVTLTATVSPAAGSSGTPTGSVSFTDQTTNTAIGSATLATVNGVRVALLSTSALTTAGAHIIQAAYQGDANFTASSSAPYTQTVSGGGGGKVTPTVDLTANGATSITVTEGDSVTFVARVHAASGYPVPDGSVTISDSTNGANQYGSANVGKDPNSKDGLATIVTSGLAPGSYNLVGTYGGDNEGKYYNGARSNTVSVTVKPKEGGPAAQPTLAISAAAGTRNGTLVPVSLTITNNSTVAADAITLNEVALRTLAGAGQAVLISPQMPLSVGSLQPGQSTVIALELQAPVAQLRFALTENGTLQDQSGTVYRFSFGQVILP